MDFLVLGLNYKSSPLEVRERVSFSPSEIFDALRFLQKYPHINDPLILSTCNRVEIYAYTKDKKQGLNNLKGFFYTYHEIRKSLEPYLYSYENSQAIWHLFRVTSSLDSMIVGENQILRQVKEAYLNARAAGSIGDFFSFIFQEALRVGKEVRSQTNISRGAVSISSAVVELAKNILKNLEGKKILIIGAGKMGELTVKSLSNRGIKLILVANRTYEKAVSLAEVFHGKAIRFKELPLALNEVDIVISSTAAPHYILKVKDLISTMKKRGGRPLFLIDLSVPRNIEQSCAEIKEVYLYNIDDLKKISESNLKERLKEADKAEEIVKAESNRVYAKIVEGLLHEPVRV